MLSYLVLEAHPGDRTKDNNGHEDYGQDTSKGDYGAGVGGCGYGLNHVVDGGD